METVEILTANKDLVNQLQKQHPMMAEIKVWSNIGVTPITKRGGNYCDLLVDKKVAVKSISEARHITNQLINETEFGYKGFFYVSDHPNQNINNGWL